MTSPTNKKTKARFFAHFLKNGFSFVPIIFLWVCLIGMILGFSNLVKEKSGTITQPDQQYASYIEETNKELAQETKNFENTETKLNQVEKNDTTEIENTETIQQTKKYVVTKVIDGDTIKVKNDEGIIQTIRLIGIDAPEMSKNKTKTECYALESKKFLEKVLTGEIVTLEEDLTQGNTDKYQRLLRYVYVDGELINLTLIQKGFAREYTYDAPYKFQFEFIEAEKSAKKNNLGLWGECKKI
ncbi:thermonuclease family protein [Candidatus Dojkabacteria bacterium]|uniref:Thermonuclease family protein n=1 Tax=Candidatus Dojkabacteria bacterium TaxID=2099670 RepID=A0A3M0YY08_9BACT|nr:MAG: thermonuclease family protein [Candidatus Dojkabacteria bacterium]